MQKYVALITGANKGLGLEIARQLGQKDITVLVAARSLEKATTASETLRREGIDARPLELDVTNSEHVARLASVVEGEAGRLDILINNAGVQLDVSGADLQPFRETFEVNVFAPYAITETLLPLLLASPNGRIVNQSSMIGSIGMVSTNPDVAAWGGPAYASSKAALNMLTVHLAQRLKDTKIKVNSAHPGWVKTDLGGQEAPMNTVDGAKTAVSLAILPEEGPTGQFFHLDDTLPW